MTDRRRRLEGLNPSDRPVRSPGVPPPPRPAATPGAEGGILSSTDDALRRHAPTSVTAAGRSRLAGSTRPVDNRRRGKAGKVMHSVPVDVVEELKQTAARTGKTYTEIALECVVRHRDDLDSEQREVSDLGVLERRVQHAGRQRNRTAQLTLYLTPAERQALDELAARLDMARSHLVTEALERGLAGVR